MRLILAWLCVIVTYGTMLYAVTQLSQRAAMAVTIALIAWSLGRVIAGED